MYESVQTTMQRKFERVHLSEVAWHACRWPPAPLGNAPRALHRLLLLGTEVRDHHVAPRPHVQAVQATAGCSGSCGCGRGLGADAAGGRAGRAGRRHSCEPESQHGVALEWVEFQALALAVQHAHHVPACGGAVFRYELSSERRGLQSKWSCMRRIRRLSPSIRTWQHRGRRLPRGCGPRGAACHSLRQAACGSCGGCPRSRTT